MAFLRRDREVVTNRRFRSVGFALVAAGFALSTGLSAALAGGSSAVRDSRLVISPQYQAKNVSNAVEAEPQGSTANPLRGGTSQVAAEADPSNSQTRYHAVDLQYQLPASITRPAIAQGAPDRLGIVERTRSATSRPIGARKVISTATPGLDRKDVRRLFRLGLVLGLAYLVFLVLWLWRTRIRPHGRRRVVRY
jgi:cobalamin biosynthesis Mg chelatase CobN